MTCPKCCLCFPKRYQMVLLCCLGMLIIHAMRVNIAVTVVTILDPEPIKKVGSVSAVISLPDVHWDAKEIGLLHSVFYAGFLLTLVPGGYLATQLPSHRLFGGSILGSCALNLLLPVCIDKGGYIATCLVRGLQGLSEGLLYPSCYAILRHWTTPEEKSRMGAIVLTGVYTGAVVGLPLSGYLTHYYDWGYVYYVHGGVGLVWFIVWLFLSYERPSEHPHILESEKKLIEAAQGQTAIYYENDRIPWKDILLSLPVAAVNVANFARSFVFFLLLTNEPAYLNVFGFTLAENGVFSSLPHILMAITAVVSGLIADVLFRDKLLTPTNVRKMLTCIGFGAEAACFLLLAFAQTGTSALIFLTLGVGFSGFSISGWQINHLDLAPRYASALVAISTLFGTVAGIIMPIIIGHMTVVQSIQNWQLVFLLTSIILWFAVVFYGIFGSGEKQPWAEPVPDVKIVDKSDPTTSLCVTPTHCQVGHDHTYGSVKENSVQLSPEEEHVKYTQPKKETNHEPHPGDTTAIVHRDENHLVATGRNTLSPPDGASVEDSLASDDDASRLIPNYTH